MKPVDPCGETRASTRAAALSDAISVRCSRSDLGDATAVTATQPCRIEIVEAGSGWPVPLVELRTTHHQRFVTDNAGVIAMDSPELIGREMWFDVIGQGYEVPKDGFGFRGVRLTPQAGKTLKVEVQRSIIARRIGRITGGGLFAECQKLGDATDSPDSGILGCDSVQTAVHRGKMYWAWGDTVVPTYPAGIFDGTSATTAANPLTSFEPPLRLRLDYITGPNGAPRGIAKLPGEGPTWVTGYANLLDKSGAERLVCRLYEDQATDGNLSMGARSMERQYQQL